MNHTSAPALARIRLTSTEELLAAVPYLIGFEPRDSIVILVFENSQLQVGARLDIAALHHPVEFQSSMDSLRRRYPHLSAAVFVYSHDPFVGMMACDEVVQALRGCDIIEAARVHGHRFWPLLCDCPACQREGHPFDAKSTMVAAPAVAAGLQVVSSRSEAVQAATGPDGDELVAATSRYESATKRLSGQSVAQRRTRLRELLLTGADNAQGLCDDDLAEIGVLVRQASVRDEAFTLALLTEPATYLDVWGRVVAQCPDEWAVGGLCLLGIAAWRGGQGALLSECVTRASGIDPGDSWVQFLAEVIDDVIPPKP